MVKGDAIQELELAVLDLERTVQSLEGSFPASQDIIGILERRLEALKNAQDFIESISDLKFGDSIAVKKDSEDEFQFLKNFVSFTGGGEGSWAQCEEHFGTSSFNHTKRRESFEQKVNSTADEQSSWVKGDTGRGYGCIKFSSEVSQDPHRSNPYIRIPLHKIITTPNRCESDLSMVPLMLLYYIENVWQLKRPKLLISITGGAQDFEMDRDKENVLFQLMEAARKTQAWLVTGGTDAGIMKYVGQARQRFGGNVPLVGIAAWGCLRGRAQLTVADNAAAGGFLSQPRVKYEPSRYVADKLTTLDCNHTHFILVDDGTVGKFGIEVPLRGRLEALACQTRGGRAEAALSRRMQATHLGWDRARDAWRPSDLPQNDPFVLQPPVTGSGAKESAQELDGGTGGGDGSFALCLCFEGGVGSIKTVAEAVRNRLPALIMNSSGRAADLISDCVRLFDSERLPIERGEGEGPVVERAQLDPFESSKMHRVVLLKRYLLFMQELFDHAHDRNDLGWSWPLTKAMMDNSVDYAAGDDWQNFRRTEIHWRLRHPPTSSAAAALHALNPAAAKRGAPPETLVVGTPWHLTCAVQLSVHIFNEYALGANPAGALDVMCQLFDCCRSRLCVVYDLDARTMRDGNPEPLDVLEYVVKCLLRGLHEEANRRRMKSCLRTWRATITADLAHQLPSFLPPTSPPTLLTDHLAEPDWVFVVRFLKGVCGLSDRTVLNELRKLKIRPPTSVEAFQTAGVPAWIRGKPLRVGLAMVALHTARCHVARAAIRAAQLAVSGDPNAEAASQSAAAAAEWRQEIVARLVKSCKEGLERERSEEARMIGAGRDDPTPALRAKVRELMDVEKVTQLQELKILIQWGNVEMVRVMLDVLGDQRARCWMSARTVHVDKTSAIMLDKGLLCQALHLSLKQGRVEMVRLFLDRGAGTDLYGRLQREKNQQSRYWKWLLAAACDRMNEVDDYLRRLVLSNWVFNSALFMVAHNAERHKGASSALELMANMYKDQRLLLGDEDWTNDERFTQGLQRIQDDAHARSIIQRMVSSILAGAPDPGLAGGGIGVRRGLRLDPRQATADFDLFVFVLISGGPAALAKIFWERDGRYNPSLLLQNALLGCILCRGLLSCSMSPRARHLREQFERSAAELEATAGAILADAARRDFERALRGLDMGYPPLPGISTLDLAFRAEARELVKLCSPLITRAVERRFGSLAAALGRLNRSIAAAAAGLLAADAGLLYDGEAKLMRRSSARRLSLGSMRPTFLRRRNSSSGSYSPNIRPVAPPPAPAGWAARAARAVWQWAVCWVAGRDEGLLWCMLLDLPVAFNWIAVIWPGGDGGATSVARQRVDMVGLLVGTVPAYQVFGGSWLWIAVMSEELLPLLSSPPHPDMLPSALVAWAWLRVFPRHPSGNPATTEDEAAQAGDADLDESQAQEGRSYTPADYFAVDLVAHLAVSFLLTQLIMHGGAATSAFDAAIEILVLVYFLLDEIPDILLEGLPDKEEGGEMVQPYSLREVVFTGFGKYLSISGERVEFFGMGLFVAGFLCKHADDWHLLLVLAPAVAILACAFGPLLASRFWTAVFAAVSAATFVVAVIWWWWTVAGRGEALGSALGQAGYVLYGLSVSLVWMRSLQFVMVHKGLGQFVRVLVHMASDLWSFSLVWAIFILTFGTALLVTAGGSTAPSNPMQQWGMWWFVRTYFQSMGHPFLEELQSHWSGAVFMVMWPIFHLLLVNLLVAIMSDRYENSKLESDVDHCVALYRMTRTYAIQPRTNPFTLIYHLFQYHCSKPSPTIGAALPSQLSPALQDLNGRERRLRITTIAPALPKNELDGNRRALQPPPPPPPLGPPHAKSGDVAASAGEGSAKRQGAVGWLEGFKRYLRDTRRHETAAAAAAWGMEPAGDVDDLRLAPLQAVGTEDDLARLRWRAERIEEVVRRQERRIAESRRIKDLFMEASREARGESFSTGRGASDASASAPNSADANADATADSDEVASSSGRRRGARAAAVEMQMRAEQQRIRDALSWQASHFQDLLTLTETSVRNEVQWTARAQEQRLDSMSARMEEALQLLRHRA